MVIGTYPSHEGVIDYLPGATYSSTTYDAMLNCGVCSEASFTQIKCRLKRYFK